MEKKSFVLFLIFQPIKLFRKTPNSKKCLDSIWRTYSYSHFVSNFNFQIEQSCKFEHFTKFWNVFSRMNIEFQAGQAIAKLILMTHSIILVFFLQNVGKHPSHNTFFAKFGKIRVNAQIHMANNIWILTGPDIRFK